MKLFLLLPIFSRLSISDGGERKPNDSGIPFMNYILMIHVAFSPSFSRELNTKIPSFMDAARLLFTPHKGSLCEIMWGRATKALDS
jgi:hypothetical protein